MDDSLSARPLDKLAIFSGKGVQMRTFHLTWLTFFFCFFGWFGIAPLMPLVREQLHLDKGQIGNIVIASVSATILARLVIGKLCDTLGPRLTYTLLLVVGALPVMLIGLSNSYQSFLLFRLAIGIIGASFVITQFHTSMMFAPNVVGTANAVAGGWGNLGGGIANMVMPLVAAGFVSLGYVDQANSWRLAMVVPGVILLIMAWLYYKYTVDTPRGNYADIPRDAAQKPKGTFLLALRDYRTWVLALAYGACFGIEITIDNVAAVYFVDHFGATLVMAGMLAGIFGFMNIFARGLGGWVSDLVGRHAGLRGKWLLLSGLLVLEGGGIALFALAPSLPLAIAAMLGFALFLKMANGCTYSIVPFVNKQALGSVSGVVGAGGNLGAMLVGFLFKSASISYSTAFLYIGIGVAAVGGLVLLVRLVRKEIGEATAETTSEAPLTLAGA
ncbi:MFS transporter [Hymenobacter chitinivorans]|uniref:NNP family nitrate/nitrite transporter-like MFS transporter n=1 Tax=Hymenobacter chitinivorans DSM 11115 TaxID=1121954 RepID=A0A2M9BRW3_9BACT|nr:MFS transporter [Hymenobacter chitinivorans]PJJ60700.1 NNP family nitrate/nitrite transporter-like MFS transporter [Hymenobacter chitinivorans DSM 11115]